MRMTEHQEKISGSGPLFIRDGEENGIPAFQDLVLSRRYRARWPEISLAGDNRPLLHPCLRDHAPADPGGAGC